MHRRTFIGAAAGLLAAGCHTGQQQLDVPNPDSNENPNQLRTGLWSDRERRRSEGQHRYYKVRATHRRTQPIHSQFTGECQTVRVSLPQTRPADASYIGTFVGRVEPGDHWAFSVEELCELYERRFGRQATAARVELITGARWLGRRFAPISCFIAYASAEAVEPSFYAIEAASAGGVPKALYMAPDMDTVIHQQAGFHFAPLGCASNWYTGMLRVDAGGHPNRVHVRSAQDHDGGHAYFELDVRYELDPDPKRVLSPLALQAEAASRAMAITREAGCKLTINDCGEVRAVEPNRKHQRDDSPAQAEDWRYCGCPNSRR